MGGRGASFPVNEKRIVKKSTPSDITEQFLRIPENRNISMDAGYAVADRRNEILIAEWLVNNLGGDIHLLKESEIDGVKTPDYLWRGQHWEAKSASSKTSVDKRLRQSSKQIAGNCGGVVLDIGAKKLSTEVLVNYIRERMAKRLPTGSIVIVKEGSKLVGVYVNK